jgi:predicted metallo-beta-lactamase superfamily hydrolase
MHLVFIRAIVVQKITVHPIAADSMGVRSMACGIKTPDLTILLDPGCSLGPHGDLKIPHPEEWHQNQQRTRELVEYSKNASILFLSHFHRDHYKPPETDYFYLYSDTEICRTLYTDKIIYHKHPIHAIGYQQQLRAKEILPVWQHYAKEVHAIEGSTIEIQEYGNTKLEFPSIYAHNHPRTRLGSIQPLIIRYEDEAVYFFPDVHGLIYAPDRQRFRKEITENLQKRNAGNPPGENVLIMGGPPNEFGRHIFQSLRNNFEPFDDILIDHHCYRKNTELERWLEFCALTPEIFSYFGYINQGQERCSLQNVAEINRTHLFEKEPPTEAYLNWGNRCLAGDPVFIKQYPPL